jgi:predicted Zn-ribbon and HTH transcriptional regulator
MPDRTTRERIADHLREETATAEELARVVEIPERQVYDHVEHVAKSVADDEQLLAAPPECRDCGFDGFDDPVNAPSRCPECYSENLTRAQFRIES